MEKKLNDEEIVKALETCMSGKGCEDCSYFEKNIDCVRRSEKDTLDLIHRLQEENGLLNGSRENLLADKILLQEEVERLTEEHERIAWSKQQYLDWVHGFLSTHTDMKDRGEKFKMFDRDWMCGVFWEKIESSIEYIIDLENQRNELQKQVDELKKANNDLLHERQMAFMDGHQQAVKDTAKEIYLWLQDKDQRGMIVPFNMVLSQFKERYGVEVE